MYVNINLIIKKNDVAKQTRNNPYRQKKVSSYWDWESGEELTTKGHEGTIQGDGSAIHLDNNGIYKTVCTF